jgi:DNA-binding CsgD family transcriptional regulator
MRVKRNKEIADKLFIAIHTVKNHIYSLYQKLGVKSRGQLVHLIMNAQKKYEES